MRYALRNKHKIEAAYSRQVLDDCIASLDNYFRDNDSPRIITHPGEKHPTLTVGGFSFYIISTVYDIYKLALKDINIESC